MTTRDATPGDLNYVIASWLANYWETAKVFPEWQRRGQHAFQVKLNAEIREALANGMRVLVASEPEAPAVVCGWIAFGPGPVLHYVLVPRQLRRQGIAHELIAEAAMRFPVSHTFRTPDLSYLPGARSSDYAPQTFPPRKTA